LGWGRPQIQGWARALSWAVATWVAWAVSSGPAKACPASAWRRKIRHQPSCRFSQQAPLGMKAWSRGYNLLGEVTSATTPNSGATSMSYDPNGNLTGTTDANNTSLTFTYDVLNRETGEYDGPSTSSPQLAAWVYDNSNNVAGLANPIGHLTTETSYVGGNAGRRAGRDWVKRYRHRSPSPRSLSSTNP
jgi:YD repeat-containing protein